MLEPHRLDLRVEELKALIRFLETITGRGFDQEKFIQVMELVNEQEDYLRKVRDLIAATVPCPVGLVDQLPATMNLQWHRGTEWGRDMARKFYEEVRSRVKQGKAAWPQEKLRLMWIGAGLWHDTAFYQFFERQYGAVFVSSIYLSIAADGYARKIKGDPLRALASRHLSMRDLIYDPRWLLKEARLHRVNGAVMVISPACVGEVGRRLIRRTFEQAGIPVLTLYADVVDAREWDEEAVKRKMTTFIESRLLKGRGKSFQPERKGVGHELG